MNIISSIALKVQGADQAAKEISKLTSEYEKAGKAAGDMGADIAPPSGIGQGGAGGSGWLQDFFDRRNEAASDRRKEAADRYETPKDIVPDKGGARIDPDKGVGGSGADSALKNFLNKLDKAVSARRKEAVDDTGKDRDGGGWLQTFLTRKKDAFADRRKEAEGRQDKPVPDRDPSDKDDDDSDDVSERGGWLKNFLDKSKEAFSKRRKKDEDIPDSKPPVKEPKTTPQKRSVDSKLRSPVMGAATGIGSAVGSVSGGDVMGAVGQGAVGLGGTIPIAGIALAAGGVALKVMSVLAQKEFARASVGWGSGTAQRLDAGYFSGGGKTGTRSLRLGLGREGVPTQVVDSLMDSLSRSGGELKDQRQVSNFRQAARDTIKYGADAGAVGQFMGLRTMGGVGKQYDQSYMRVGEAAFGKGQVTRFLQSISGAIEGGMALGLTKGSKDMKAASTETAKMLHGLTTQGGLTAIGAQQLEKQTRSSMQFGSQITSPEQFRRYMLQADPSLSYSENIKNMQKGQPMMTYVRKLRETYGGDEDQMKNELISQNPNLSIWQIEALIKTSADPKGSAKGILKEGELKGLTGAAVPTDKRGAQSLYRSKQMEILAGVELQSAETMKKFNQGLVDILHTMKAFGGLEGISLPKGDAMIKPETANTAKDVAKGVLSGIIPGASSVLGLYDWATKGDTKSGGKDKTITISNPTGDKKLDELNAAINRKNEKPTTKSSNRRSGNWWD